MHRRRVELEGVLVDSEDVDMDAADSEDPPADSPAVQRIQNLIELKKIMLRDLQRRVRRDTSEFQERILAEAPDDADELVPASRRVSKKALRLARLERLERERLLLDQDRPSKADHTKFLDMVVEHSKGFREWHSANHQGKKKLAKMIMSHISNMERREAQHRERQERERIRALKANDEEAYMALLAKAKNDRLSSLMQQTNDYLAKIGVLIEKEKEKEKEDDDEDMPPVKSEGDDEETPKASGSGTNTYYTAAHKITEEITEQPDMLEGGQLKPYQMAGLQWLVSLYNNKLNGILADEMGLGKTIQTIALVSYLMERKMNNGPYLVIVPLSTLANWTAEFEKWSPRIVCVVYKGQPRVRKSLYDNFVTNGKFNVLITTYEYIIKDKSSLCKIKWNYIIIDEGHRMKNHNCKLSSMLQRYYISRHRLLLTGTPLQNNLPELWSLLNFLLPSIFDSPENFLQWFNAPFAAAGEKVDVTEEEELLVIHRLHKVLRPFMFRRLKTDVEAQLPDKIEKVLKCDMSSMQRRMYQLLHEKGVMKVGATMSSASQANSQSVQNSQNASVKGLMNTMMQLRKICNHPYMFNEDGSWDVNEDFVRCAGKFDLLDRILPKLKATGHRVLLFSQMTSLLNLLEVYFNFRSYTYMRLDGTTKAEDRGVLLEKFNAKDSEYFIFILSTRAGGLGLNLQTADTVVLFDSDWNPQMDLQAQDRAHRIGQTHEVRVLRLVTLDSIEEHILARANSKLDMDAKIIQAGRFNNKSSATERKEILEQLLKSVSANGQSAEGLEERMERVPNDEEINEMLARTDDEFDLFQKMDQERDALALAQAKAAARAAGRQVLPTQAPSRLMTDDELPPWLLQDHTQEDDVDNLAAVYGHGMRARKEVQYSDLTDKQFERMLDKGVEYGAALELANAKRKRKADKQAAGYEDDQPEVVVSGSGSGQGLPLLKIKLAKKPAADETSTLKKGTPPPSIKGKEVDKGKAPRKGRGPGKKKSLTPLGQAMLEVWRRVRDDTDPSLAYIRSAMFIKLPSKRDYPDYYITIQRPIDMTMIQKRIEQGQYTSPSQFEADFDLLFGNAQFYNEPGSPIFLDAQHLHRVFKENFKALCMGSGSANGSSSSSSSSSKPRPTCSDDEDDLPLQAMHKKHRAGVQGVPPARVDSHPSQAHSYSSDEEEIPETFEEDEEM
eukprot:TRINITY_DN4621_c0_g1_i1.p1 TRINITY_DN4621_c0_g1~~TRINITY_DN4621_c0_g1_i1.p1  ORF type:complete len:1181 (-),score=433.08 TRINITY_DN4621_c0_g1_i1:55-3597(-)